MSRRGMGPRRPVKIKANKTLRVTLEDDGNLLAEFVISKADTEGDSRNGDGALEWVRRSLMREATEHFDK